MKILYVEDNSLDADLTRRALKNYRPDWDLSVETSLKSARQTLSSGLTYDILLADLNLPDGSGLDLVADVRTQGQPLAIVMLTSAGDEDTVVAALRAGADDYLPKRDGYLDRLPATLEAALTRYRQDAGRKPHRLRVLYVEHNATDVDLTNRHLAQYAPHIVMDIVHNTTEVMTRLTHPEASGGPYDLLLMDYRLHGLNALEIMKVLREGHSVHIPVVLVTGQGNEDIAAQALRMGAADYLTKHEGYLVQLPMVLENAYHRSRLAMEHAALQVSEERFRLLAENAQDIIFRFRLLPDQMFEYISPVVTAITGYTPQVFYDNPQLSFEMIHPDDVPLLGAARETRQPEMVNMVRMRCKDGRWIWVEVNSTGVYDNGGRMIAIEGIARDVTERKRLEQAEHEERMLAEALLDITAAINSTLDLNEVLTRILMNLEHVIPHDGSNIMMLDHQTRAMRVVGFCDCYAANGLSEPSLETPHELDKFQALSDMVQTRQPVLITDAKKTPEQMPFGPVSDWVSSYLGAPIRSDGELIGLLNLESRKPDAFSESHMLRLVAFADQAAIAIRNAQHYRELEAFSEDLQLAVDERTAELRQVKERVEAVINNSPDAILLLAPSGQIDIGNPAFFEWFGYDPDGLHNRALADLAVPGFVAAIEESLKVAITKRETPRIEIKAQRKNGEEFDVMMALAPITEAGELIGVVCSLQDISKLKEVERMKDAFVSNVSHELRTPITSIRLNQKLIHINPERQQVYLGRMEREVARLNVLIEDLLRLSRLDAGRVELELAPVDLNDLVDEHVGDRSPIAESRSQTLSGIKQPDLPLVVADRGLLGQALSVLLTNALNYTPPGGEITIRTKTTERNGNPCVGFAVANTGSGIPPEDREHIFERFFRGEAGRKSGNAGTGLGLAIANEIVSLHHGEIVVGENQVPDQKVEFSVWLPLRDGPHNGNGVEK